MDNPEKLATKGTQKEDRQKKNITQYVLTPTCGILFFIDKKHHILKHYLTIVYFNGHFTSNSSYVGIKQQFLSYYT
jgi:hypothetical protein